MLTPYRVDTNSLYLTGQLNELGVDVTFKSVVGDDLRRLVGAAQHALFRSDIVIFSGGLGPTEDDLTRQALAAVMGVPLDLHEGWLKRLYEFFEKVGRPMPPVELAVADDGEVLFRGPTLFKGYWQDPEATARAPAAQPAE